MFQNKDANNPKKSSTTKIGGHIVCRYSIWTIWNFSIIESQQRLYSGEDCMKNVCSYLREHATNVINFEKKEILLLPRKN